MTMGIMSAVVPDMVALPSRPRSQSRVAPGQMAPVKTLALYPWEYRGTPRPATLTPRPGA